jgi:hypothetical protein
MPTSAAVDAWRRGNHIAATVAAALMPAATNRPARKPPSAAAALRTTFAWPAATVVTIARPMAPPIC